MRRGEEFKIKREGGKEKEEMEEMEKMKKMEKMEKNEFFFPPFESIATSPTVQFPTMYSPIL